MVDAPTAYVGCAPSQRRGATRGLRGAAAPREIGQRSRLSSWRRLKACASQRSLYVNYGELTINQVALRERIANSGIQKREVGGEGQNRTVDTTIFRRSKVIAGSI